MRILLMVVLGLILAACGQDYEEVYGIKIGGNISEMKDLAEYTEDLDITENADGKKGRFFYKENQEGLFKSIGFYSIDGIVDSVHLVSLDDGVSEEEMTELIGALNNRWGALNEYEYGWAIPTTKSDIVGYIELHSIGKKGEFTLMYSRVMPEFTIYGLYSEKSKPKYNKETFKSL